MFREEKRVHVVQEDNGWEESDEAWELGEGEMIVRTVQQEDECSWQAACDAWEVQEEEATAGVPSRGGPGVRRAGNKGPVQEGQCRRK